MPLPPINNPTVVFPFPYPHLFRLSFFFRPIENWIRYEWNRTSVFTRIYCRGKISCVGRTDQVREFFFSLIYIRYYCFLPKITISRTSLWIRWKLWICSQLSGNRKWLSCLFEKLWRWTISYLKKDWGFLYPVSNINRVIHYNTASDDMQKHAKCILVTQVASIMLLLCPISSLFFTNIWFLCAQ